MLMHPGKSPKMKLFAKIIDTTGTTDQNKLKPRRSWFPLS